MAPQVLLVDADGVLNHCTRTFARDDLDPRHEYVIGVHPSPRGAYCEAWRFPIIDSFNAPSLSREDAYRYNRVTFVHHTPRGSELPAQVGVVGTFGDMYEPVPMQRLPDTRFFAMSVRIHKGELHRYKFVVDGKIANDALNPQETATETGDVWSRFFTWGCTTPLCFERWELAILDRLTAHILPFRVPDAEIFLRNFYDYKDDKTKATEYRNVYRLDQSVGVVSFIDKLLAKEESHHLVDYKICLELIDQVLRRRNPFMDPQQMPVGMYETLYNDMGMGNVSDWDYARYGNPRYFLQLLRRHTFTGAFSHPKYGGNAMGGGWAWLSEMVGPFDWRQAMERPLGASDEYLG